jgi:PAS domain S-box-containing protein
MRADGRTRGLFVCSGEMRLQEARGSANGFEDGTERFMDTAEQLKQMRAAGTPEGVSLESVLTTAELARRTGRAPDYQAENRALLTLAQTLARSPETLLQTLCELTLPLCRAQSAGISILEEQDGELVFRWRALAGAMAPYRGGILPHDFAPCSITMERDSAQLFTQPGRYYPYAAAIQPPVHELLLIPFHLDERPVGTLWVTRTQEALGFDEEDVRLLKSLADFAAAAWRVSLTREASAQATRALDAAAAARGRQGRLFDTVLSSIVDFVYTFDREGRVTYANQALLDLWQRKLEDACGKNVFELGYPADIAGRLQRQIETVFAEGNMLKDEMALTLPSGVSGVYEYIFVPIFGGDGSVEAVAGSTRDITQRYAMEEALRDAQERLEATLNAGDIATWTWDIPANRVHADQNLARFFALTPAAAAGGPIEEYEQAIHPADRARVRQTILEAVRSGREYEAEYRLVQPQGEIRWVIARGKTEVDAQGNALRLPGVLLDITARKAAEEAQRRSEERYRTLFQAIDEGFGVIEMLFDADDRPVDYRFLEVNPAFEKVTGLQDATGKRMREMVPELEANWYEIYGKVALTGEPVRFINETHALADRWFDVYAFRLGGEQSRKVAMLFRDITAARRSERILRDHVEEIAALNARLQRAMTETHHRVKNNLQMIAAMIEMQMQEHRAEQTMPIEEFAQLKTHIHTLSIVHELLTQSMKEAEDDQRVSTQAVLDQLLPMLHQTAWNREVRFTVEEVRLTAKQCVALALVLNELVTNALKHGHQEAEVFFRVEGAQAMLDVLDDGPGFPAGFDPMQAANMGLELVESLIRTDLKGRSRYETRPKGGGRVLVSFPLPPLEQ